jgi:hypothetical protein
MSPYNTITISNPMGARGGAVGWDIALQIRSSRVRFPMVSLEFFIDIIVPWGWQKWVPGIFSLGGGGVEAAGV